MQQTAHHACVGCDELVLGGLEIGPLLGYGDAQKLVLKALLRAAAKKEQSQNGEKTIGADTPQNLWVRTLATSFRTRRRRE
eukprot:6208271-Pleurochrysis_carterae.AAC.2